MDTNIVYFLVGIPLLFGVIIWAVLFSRRQHQKNIAQTSIKSHEARTGKLAR